MDFFGLGLGGDLSTPIGQAIERATSDVLVAPDWAQNLELCDMINSTPDGPDQAVRALRRRLKHDKPSVVLLTLTIVETCVKNCGVNFHRAIATNEFMADLVTITQGKKGGTAELEALRLIQQWGLAFKNRQDELAIFPNTYHHLKNRRKHFPPPDEHDVPVFDPPAHAPTSQGSNRPAPAPAPSPAPAPTSAPAPAAAPAQDSHAKLDADLDAVMEKVRLCREMLPESPGIQQDEALSEVVGFLEACRDRMVDLIEAGTQGMLGEDLLEKSLRVNDALLRTLEAEKTGKVTFDDELTPTSSSAKPATTSNLLDFEDSPAAEAPSRTQAALQSAELDDDEFSSLNLKTSRKVGGKPRAGGPVAAPIATSAPLLTPQSTHPGTISPSGIPTTTPTPFNSVQNEVPAVAGADLFASSGDIGMLFGTDQPPVVPAAPAAATAPPATATTSTTLMSDDDFENFLSSMSGTTQRF